MAKENKTADRATLLAQQKDLLSVLAYSKLSLDASQVVGKFGHVENARRQLRKISQALAVHRKAASQKPCCATGSCETKSTEEKE